MTVLVVLVGEQYEHHLTVCGKDVNLKLPKVLGFRLAVETTFKCRGLNNLISGIGRAPVITIITQYSH